MTSNNLIAGVWKLKSYTRRFLDPREVRTDREFINTLTWERVEALPALP